MGIDGLESYINIISKTIVFNLKHSHGMPHVCLTYGRCMGIPWEHHGKKNKTIGNHTVIYVNYS